MSSHAHNIPTTANMEERNAFIFGDENHWERGPLPSGRNIDGRPIWEPPIFAYSDMIDEYEKQKKAVLEYADGDIVKTTEIMDEMIDVVLTDRYVTWIGDNMKATDDRESLKFLRGLWDAFHEDWWESPHEFRDLRLMKKDAETWEVKSWSLMKRLEEEGVGAQTGNETSSEPDMADESSSVEEERRESHDTLLDRSAKPELQADHAGRPLAAGSRLKHFPSQLSQPLHSRVRSLTPNWRTQQQSPSSSSDKNLSQNRSKTFDVQPLALRLVALKSCSGDKERARKEIAEDEALD